VANIVAILPIKVNMDTTLIWPHKLQSSIDVTISVYVDNIIAILPIEAYMVTSHPQYAYVPINTLTYTLIGVYVEKIKY
jgi:hypothetical protein